jgi:spore germination protein YaaH
VYDYGQLAQQTDWLSLMSYEQHTAATGPGPVAGIDWVKQISVNSATGIDPHRLYLGLAFYHRDWTLGRSPTAGGYDEAVSIASANDAGINWDFATGAAYFRYRDGPEEHVVWMEDLASLAAKVRLAQEMKVAGVSTWRLALEDPAFWELWPSR